VDFSQSSDLFVNIFQILVPNCKITDCGSISEKQRGLSAKSAKTGPRVDFKETQGLLCKMARNFGWGFIFQRIKSWTGSTRPWTGRARSIHRGPTAVRTEGVGAQRRPHRLGRNRERRARGARLGPHRSSGGGVEAGRWWCRTGGGGAR
jgi:hypothetical protein